VRAERVRRADDRVRRDQAQRLGGDPVVLGYLRRAGLRLLPARKVAPDGNRPEQVVRDDAEHQHDARDRDARIDPLRAEDGRRE